MLSAANDEPLPGVTVIAIDSGKTTTTKAKGKYALKGLPPGTHSIHFSKTGFVEKTIEDVVVK